MAAALAGTAVNVCVIDAAKQSHEPLASGFDTRVSAITPASVRFFQALGVWDDMLAKTVTVFDRMHVWEHQSGAAIHFDAADVGEQALGYIVENRVILQVLSDKIREYDHITWMDETQLLGFERHQNDQFELILNNDRRQHCDLLIGADGSRSKVRSLAAIETKGWHYDQSAIVANVSTGHPHQHTAWQCFLEGGPLAFLPLGEHHCSIVWSCEHERAQALMDLPVDLFEHELARAFQHKLGTVQLTSERARFPLQLQYVQQYVQPGLALIGDAAHSIHPLAGQGVNLGILDAASLLDVIKDAMANGDSPGSYRRLRRYERWRKGDNLGMMFLMDGFNKLFTTHSGPLKMIRNQGIKLTDSLSPLKNLIMQSASGMRGELPSILKNQRAV